MAVSPEAVTRLLGEERSSFARWLVAAVRRMRVIGERPLGAFGLVAIAIVVVLAVLGSTLASQDPLSSSSLDFAHRMQGPSGSHWLGTDGSGRDVLSELLLGARVSLLVGLVAGLVSAFLGALVGTCAGYCGGWVDRVLTFVGDWFLVMPLVPFTLLTAVLLQDDANDIPGGRTGIITLVLAFTGWAVTTRIVRARVTVLRGHVFVERARAQGASHLWILRHHILPNAMPVVWANSLVVVALAVLGEAGLSFFGLGSPGSFSWGTMLYNAFQAGAVNQGAWWYVLPPGILITLFVLGLFAVARVVADSPHPRAPGR